MLQVNRSQARLGLIQRTGIYSDTIMPITIMRSLSDSKEADGFLTRALPVEPSTFPQVDLHLLIAQYDQNIKHLNQQVRSNYTDAEWTKELKEALSDVQERRLTVQTICNLQNAVDNNHHAKALSQLRQDRTKAISMYNAFVKAHPKG